MGNPAGVRRDFEALEHRRMQAAALLRKGMSQAEVARAVGVHRQSVSRWSAQLAEGGSKALKHPGRAGRKSRLSRSDFVKIERGLQRGPEELGFETGLWTARRAAVLIEKECGVSFTPAHVWWLLRRLGWSPQRPAGRAVERDEAAIRRGKQQRWPAIKKKPSRRAGSSSS